MKYQSKNFKTEQGNRWQDHAERTLVKDGETGRTSHKNPENNKEEEQKAPRSNWPY